MCPPSGLTQVRRSDAYAVRLADNAASGRCGLRTMRLPFGGHGLGLSGVREDLPLLDQEIGEQHHDLVMSSLASELDLLLGTVIINNATGARWRRSPNGQPAILTASAGELDVVAMVNRRIGPGGPRAQALRRLSRRSRWPGQASALASALAPARTRISRLTSAGGLRTTRRLPVHVRKAKGLEAGHTATVRPAVRV